MRITEIAKDSYWVGKVDNRKVSFHRLVLEKGTTYNSYLLKTGKPTIIDTVDIAFGKEYVENLSSVIDLSTISYIVINHVEPDHAGALPALVGKAKNATIVTTSLGARLLQGMFKLDEHKFMIIKDGDTLDIGGKTLAFYETPFLHTEETMVTYAVEDGVLYPCDLFSTHIATSKLFNDLAEEDFWEDFKVYYQLIMAPHRPYVRKMLEKISPLDIKMVAPSHGYILRENVSAYIDLYEELSLLSLSAEPKRVTVVYSSMTGNTGKVAQRLAKGLEENGVYVSVFNLKNAELDEVVAQIAQSDGVLVGSATKYADMVGKVEELLVACTNNVKPGVLGAAFGSYGWSGEAISHVQDYLAQAGFTVVNNDFLIKNTGVSSQALPLRVQFADERGLQTAEEAAQIFAEQLLRN